jgi:hypothetical protein
MKRNVLVISTFVVLICFAFNYSTAQYKIPTNLNPDAFAFTQSTPSSEMKNGEKAVLTNESFDGTTFPPSGWITTPGVSANWSRLTAGTHPAVAPHSGAGMAMFNSWTAGSGETALLVSPSFSCTGNNGSFSVSFWMYHESQYSTYVDSITLFVNSTNSLAGSPVRLGGEVRPIGSGWIKHTYFIPASVNGTTEYLIFRGTSRAGNDIHIDDVLVTSPFPNDIGVTSVDLNTYYIAGAVIPKATIKNFGTSAQNNFNVRMNVNSTPPYIQTVMVTSSLAAGASTQVTFPAWTAPTGNWTAKAVTLLIADQNHSNDSIQKNVSILASLTSAFCFKNKTQPSKFYLEVPNAGFTDFGSSSSWQARGGAYVATGPNSYKWFVLSEDFNLFSVDTLTGVTTLIGATGVPSTGTYFLPGLTYDKTTSTLYAGYITGSYPNFNFSLYTINQTTGHASFIATSATQGTFLDIACSSTGQMYAIEHRTTGFMGRLFSVNKTTAEMTLIGTNLGGVVSSNFQNIGFAPNGFLYYSASMGSDGTLDGLYTINTTTGIATLVGTFPLPNIEVTGLGIRNYNPLVSINENSDNNFSIFPNPATDKISILSKDNEIIKNVKVISISGQIVFEENTNFIATTLNTGNYKAGFYIVQVLTEKGFYTSKITILK